MFFLLLSREKNLPPDTSQGEKPGKGRSCRQEPGERWEWRWKRWQTGAGVSYPHGEAAGRRSHLCRHLPGRWGSVPKPPTIGEEKARVSVKGNTRPHKQWKDINSKAEDEHELGQKGRKKLHRTEQRKQTGEPGNGTMNTHNRVENIEAKKQGERSRKNKEKGNRKENGTKHTIGR